MVRSLTRQSSSLTFSAESCHVKLELQRIVMSCHLGQAVRASQP
jgi:hypothetical protein